MVAATSALPLLTASFTHEYFGGDFEGFRVEALPATASACRRLGLRLLQDGSNLTLMTMPDAFRGVDPEVAQPALASATLCWQVIPRASDFWAYTATDFLGSSQCLVFASAASVAKGGPLTVGASASAQDVWERRPLRFDFRPAKPLPAGAILSLKTASGSVLRSLTVTSPLLVGVDTSDVGSGLYQLSLGSLVLLRWFADERPFPPSEPGAILVLSGSQLAGAYAIAGRKAGSPATPPEYTAAFASRSVLWRYHIFNAKGDETFSIVPFNGEELEAPPAAPARARGPRAVPDALFQRVPGAGVPGAQSFEAVSPLKLALLPPQRFALTNGAAIRYAPLPLGGVPLGRSETGGALCSDIFIYL
jgi:hypothetical protein